MTSGNQISIDISRKFWKTPTTGKRRIRVALTGHKLGVGIESQLRAHRAHLAELHIISYHNVATVLPDAEEALSRCPFVPRGTFDPTRATGSASFGETISTQR